LVREGQRWAVKAISRSQWNDGYGPDCGRSRGGTCRGAIRPIEASKAAVSYVRNTSTPAVRRKDQTPSELAAFAEAERDRKRSSLEQRN